MKFNKTLVVGLLAIIGCNTPGDDALLPGQGEPQADLVAVSRSSTLVLANGQSLRLSVKVANQGAVASQPVAGRWELRGPGVRDSKAAKVPALEPGQSAQFSFEYPFAPKQSGDYVLTFAADSRGELAESVEGNNRVTLWVVVAAPDAPPPPANLAVAFDVTTVTFDTGAHIIVDITVSNLGVEPVPVEGLWELEGPGLYAATNVAIAELKAGASTKITFQRVPPTRGGRLSLTFTASPGSPFRETDGADNTAVLEVLVVPYPNLTAEILSASPLAVSSASWVTVRVLWRNDGLSPVTYAAAISEPARFHLVKSGEPMDWRNFVGSVTVPVLAPGASTTVTYQLRALRGPGAYAWQVTAGAASFEELLADNTASLGGTTITSLFQSVWGSAVTTPSIAAPSTAAVNGDGTWDLVMGGLRAGSAESDLFAVDGNTGAPLWSSQVVGVPLVLRNAGNRALAFSPNAQMVSAFDVATGAWAWQYPAGPTFVSYVAADLDQDATAELLVAGYDGLALLSLTDGAQLDQWLFPQSGNSFAAAPILTDFTNDGFPDVVATTLEGWVYAYANTSGAGLTPAWDAMVDAPIVGAPVVADLTADGEHEVAFGDLSGRLYVLAATTGVSLWSVTMPVERIWMGPAMLRRGSARALAVSGSMLPSSDGWSSSLLTYDAAGNLLWRVDRPGTPGSVVAVDVDHDGRDEVLWLVGDRSPAVFPVNLPAMDDARGTLYLVSSEGAILTMFEVPGAQWFSPLAGDLDLDGSLDIIVLGAGRNGGLIRLATPFSWPAGSGWVGAP